MTGAFDARRRHTGLVLAIASAATFSTSGSFAHSLIDAGWTPGAAVAARISVAAVVIAIPALVAMRGRWSSLRRNAVGLAGYGLVAVAGAQLCFFNAVDHLSVGVALLLEYLGTVLVVGWMWLRHGQRPHRLTAIGSAIALGGLALILDVFGDNHLDPVGVLWGLGAAIGLAVFFVASARNDNNLPPITVAGGGMAVGAAALLALGAAGALPMHATFGTVEFAGHRTELARSGAGFVARGRRILLRRRHQRGPSAGRSAVVLRGADRGGLRGASRLGPAWRAADQRAAGGRSGDRGRGGPGSGRRGSQGAHRR